MLRFAQQHAVITGGSSGIGQPVALELATASANTNISILACDPNKLNEAAARIEASRADPEQRVDTYAVDAACACALLDAVQRCVIDRGPSTQLTEENKAKPAATRIVTGCARVHSPAVVARAIVTGIERKRFHMTAGLEMTLLARLRALSVPLLRQRMSRTVSICLASAEKSVGGSRRSVGGDVDAVDFGLSRSTSGLTS